MKTLAVIHDKHGEPLLLDEIDILPGEKTM